MSGTEDARRIWNILMRDYVKPVMKEAGFSPFGSTEFRARGANGDVATVRLTRSGDHFVVGHGMAPKPWLEWDCARMELPIPATDRIPWKYMILGPRLAPPRAFWYWLPRHPGMKITDEMVRGAPGWSLDHESQLVEVGLALRSGLEARTVPVLDAVVHRNSLISYFRELPGKEYTQWHAGITRDWMIAMLSMDVAPRDEAFELLARANFFRRDPECEAWMRRKLEQRFVID